jgi:hypothetical protein
MNARGLGRVLGSRYTWTNWPMCSRTCGVRKAVPQIRVPGYIHR